MNTLRNILCMIYSIGYPGRAPDRTSLQVLRRVGSWFIYLIIPSFLRFFIRPFIHSFFILKVAVFDIVSEHTWRWVEVVSQGFDLTRLKWWMYFLSMSLVKIRGWTSQLIQSKSYVCLSQKSFPFWILLY